MARIATDTSATAEFFAKELPRFVMEEGVAIHRHWQAQTTGNRGWPRRYAPRHDRRGSRGASLHPGKPERLGLPSRNDSQVNTSRWSDSKKAHANFSEGAMGFEETDYLNLRVLFHSSRSENVST